MKNEELRAVMDDLSSVTREQQVVNSELVQATQERDEARGELRSAASRTAHLEQLLRAKDKEREDILNVYQELGGEARRLSSTVAQLERDAGVREAQVSALQQENGNLQVRPGERSYCQSSLRGSYLPRRRHAPAWYYR